MASVATTVRRAARLASPRRRRYQRMLETCDLDPARLPRPVAEPDPNDVIICGCPRSGTALMAAALHQPPTMVSVMEPWDGLRLGPRQLFASLRDELAQGHLRRGRLDLERLEADGSVAWIPEGHQARAIDTTPDTLVAVKWPTYWQYLPLLPTTRFVVCVRHPADVLASFAAQPGSLAQGLEYDVAFNRHLNGRQRTIADLEQRRLALYDRANQAVLEHRDRPNVHVVRYEDWHRDANASLSAISDFLGRDLTHSRATIVAPDHVEHTTRRGAIVDRSATARALGY